VRDDASLLSLARAVVDDLGTLITGHVRLARAEITADALRYSRRLALVGLAAAVLLLGYACPCVGAALALAPRLGLPVAFVVVGGVHVLGAAVALAVVLARDAPPPFDGSFSELDRTVASLAPKPKPEPKIDGARQLAQQPASERIIPRGTA